VSSIIHRLITTDVSVIVLNQEEVDASGGTTLARKEARKLALHPNYVPPNA